MIVLWGLGFPTLRASGVRRYESVEWVWARRPRPYEDVGFVVGSTDFLTCVVGVMVFFEFWFLM